MTRLDIHELWAGGALRLLATRWQRARHPVRSTGRTEWGAIELMRTGCYRKRGRRGANLGDANTAVFFAPDERFEIDHPSQPENAGLTIRIAPAAYDALARGGATAATSGEVLAPGQVHFELHRLANRLYRGAVPDALNAEEQLVRLIVALCASRCSRAVSPPGDPRRLVQAARETLNARFDQRVTLFELADEIGCSPWHLARLFPLIAGCTVHRYLTSLRLRHALVTLAQSERDLTALGLRLGFSSHSHFTAAFRREYGVTPSQARGIRPADLEPR